MFHSQSALEELLVPALFFNEFIVLVMQVTAQSGKELLFVFFSHNMLQSNHFCSYLNGHIARCVYLLLLSGDMIKAVLFGRSN